MKRISWILLIGLWCCWSCQEDTYVADSLPDSVSEVKGALWMIKKVEHSLSTKAVGVKDKYWNLEDTIRIKFLNGEAEMQQKVKEYAAEWLKYAALYFEYVGTEEEADVKISFDGDTRALSWAAIGTDCRLIPQNEASLNFYNLGQETEAGVKAEILRGFGHVLGLGFEHKNPNSPLVFANDMFIQMNYGLTAEDVVELKELYTTNQTNYTEYDNASIMGITIPALLLTPETRQYATTRNQELSEMDKKFIAEVYPKPLMKAVVLAAGVRNHVSVGAGVNFAPVPGPHLRRVVDWGDGSQTSLLEDKYYFHDYLNDGKYVIRFYGPDTLYRSLQITDIDVKELEVNKNKDLESLLIWNSSLKSINLSQNPKIKFLSLENCEKIPLKEMVSIVGQLPDYTGTGTAGRIIVPEESGYPEVMNICDEKNWVLTVNGLVRSQRCSEVTNFLPWPVLPLEE